MAAPTISPAWLGSNDIRTIQASASGTHGSGDFADAMAEVDNAAAAQQPTAAAARPTQADPITGAMRATFTGAPTGRAIRKTMRNVMTVSAAQAPIANLSPSVPTAGSQPTSVSVTAEQAALSTANIVAASVARQPTAGTSPAAAAPTGSTPGLVQSPAGAGSAVAAPQTTPLHPPRTPSADTGQSAVPVAMQLVEPSGQTIPVAPVARPSQPIPNAPSPTARQAAPSDRAINTPPGAVQSQRAESTVAIDPPPRVPSSIPLYTPFAADRPLPVPVAMQQSDSSSQTIPNAPDGAPDGRQSQATADASPGAALQAAVPDPGTGITQSSVQSPIAADAVSVAGPQAGLAAGSGPAPNSSAGANQPEALSIAIPQAGSPAVIPAPSGVTRPQSNLDTSTVAARQTISLTPGPGRAQATVVAVSASTQQTALPSVPTNPSSAISQTQPIATTVSVDPPQSVPFRPLSSAPAGANQPQPASAGQQQAGSSTQTVPLPPVVRPGSPSDQAADSTPGPIQSKASTAAVFAATQDAGSSTPLIAVPPGVELPPPTTDATPAVVLQGAPRSTVSGSGPGTSSGVIPILVPASPGAQVAVASVKSEVTAGAAEVPVVAGSIPGTPDGSQSLPQPAISAVVAPATVASGSTAPAPEDPPPASFNQGDIAADLAARSGPRIAALARCERFNSNRRRNSGYPANRVLE